MRLGCILDLVFYRQSQIKRIEGLIYDHQLMYIGQSLCIQTSNLDTQTLTNIHQLLAINKPFNAFYLGVQSKLVKDKGNLKSNIKIIVNLLLSDFLRRISTIRQSIGLTNIENYECENCVFPQCGECLVAVCFTHA